MAKHGLTRVAFRGDRTIIIAGDIPPTVAVRGLVEEVTEVTPVETPQTKLHLQKQANKPPRFTAFKPQADEQPKEKEKVDGK